MLNLKVKGLTHQFCEEGQSLTASFSTWKGRKDIWFKTDLGEINQTIEPFLPVALIPAMRRNWNIRLEGAVAPSLLSGTDQIQQIMTSWYPRFRKVKVHVKHQEHAPNKSGAVAAFFSGGVDSFYTLKKHLDKITHLVFVHGFDVDVSNDLKRREFADNARAVAEQLGLVLVEVETNLREFGKRNVSWPDAYFGAGLASIALLLAPRFESIYIPASVSSEQLIPMGSHPDLDHHWGNGQITIIHDGIESDRFEKIKAISDWDLVSKHLRICYQSKLEGLNCGRCRKCTWTMMVLEALGRLSDIRTLPDQIDLGLIGQYSLQDTHQLDRVTKSIQYLQAGGHNDEMCEALVRLVDETRRENTENITSEKGGVFSKILRRKM